MFDRLEIHKAVDPCVFTELLIGVSPMTTTSPETAYLPRIFFSAGFYAEQRDATTEMVFGSGLDNEFVGVSYG